MTREPPAPRRQPAFLQLACERCRRRLAWSRFLMWLVAANLGLSIALMWAGAGGWSALHWADRTAFVAAIVLMVTAFWWTARSRRRVRAELAGLDGVEEGAL